MAATAGRPADPAGRRQGLAVAQETDDAQERTLSVWIHGQRIDFRAGSLDPDKEQKFNDLLPGWREGRARRLIKMDFRFRNSSHSPPCSRKGAPPAGSLSRRCRLEARPVP